MAITDINISEELQTNAPSIKYRGNEGPKSPQEQEQALLMRQLRAEYERYVAQANPNNVLSFEDWYRMSIEQQAKRRGPRAMAAYGGIMGVDGRRQYGLGSSFKKFVRKVIPNEVSKVATVAAPFVAPFNAPLAGAMAGLGSFDQTGSISDAFKSGLLTYGSGKLMSGIGGGGYQGGKTLNPLNKDFYTQFTKPYGTESGIGKMFKNMRKAPADIEVISGSDYGQFKEPVFGALENDALGGEMITTGSTTGSKINKIAEETKNPSKLINTITKYALDPKTVLGIMGLGGAAYLGSGMGVEEESLTEMDRGSGLTGEIPSGILAIRKEVIEAFKDPTGDKLSALRVKYPFLGKKDTKNLSGLAEGGRIGYANGVGPVLDVQEDDLSITDFMQDQGIPHGQMASYGYNEAMADSYDMYLEMKEKDLLPPNMTFNEFLQEMSRKNKGSEKSIKMASAVGDESDDIATQLFGKPVKDLNPSELQELWDEIDRLENKFRAAQGGRIGYALGKSVEPTQRDQMEEIEGQMAGPQWWWDRVQHLEYLGYSHEEAGQIAMDSSAYYDIVGYPGDFAQGGRIGKAVGGIMDLGGKEKDYRNTGGFVDLGAKEKADDVPARLSVNEFVMTADAVRGMGDGNIDLGAQRMENLMGHMENKGKQGAQEMFNVSERLSEVV